MEVKFEKAKEKWSIIRLTGRIESATSSEVEMAIKSQLDFGEIFVALDLSGVEYLSSAGIRLIIAAAKRAHALNGEFALISPQGYVKDVLRMSGILTSVRIVAFRAEL